MRGVAALLPLAAAAGCATAAGETIQVAGPQIHAFEAVAPVLLRYKPPEQGGPTAFPEAHIVGVLDFSGPCVRLDFGERGTSVVVAPSNLWIGRDSAGLFLQSGSQRLRHGMNVEGGGGFRSNLLANLMERPAPVECTGEGFVELTSPNPYDPTKVPPPRSPPPPPIG